LKTVIKETTIYFDAIEIAVISKKASITYKKASGRLQDKADASKLE
jgi:hypothetical protein